MPNDLVPMQPAIAAADWNVHPYLPVEVHGGITFQPPGAPYRCYAIPNRRWNGWLIPYFELVEALRVAADNPLPLDYDADADAFIDRYDQFGPEQWEGADFTTVDGVRHLYPIGAFYWCWTGDVLKLPTAATT